MTSGYDGRQIVGIEHRRRSVLVRMTPEGERLGKAKITDSPDAWRAEIAKATSPVRTPPKAMVEATYGWSGPPDRRRSAHRFLTRR